MGLHGFSDGIEEHGFSLGQGQGRPTKTWQEQVDRVLEIYQMFKDAGDNPSTSCVNHGHIHVFVPGLKQDVEGLKNLIRYVKQNQTDQDAKGQ